MIRREAKRMATVSARSRRAGVGFERKAELWGASGVLLSAHRAARAGNASGRV